MVNTENSLLNEKYRPTKLDNYVGNENIKSVISKYLEQNDIQNFIYSMDQLAQVKQHLQN